MHMFSRLIAYCFILFFLLHFYAQNHILCIYYCTYESHWFMHIFIYIFFLSTGSTAASRWLPQSMHSFIYPYLLNKNAYVYILLFLPEYIPQPAIYFLFYIYIYVCIIICTNIFLKCAYLHTHKNIIYILLAAVIYTYCTSYRMHFLFFFLFILCTPIYPFFISFLCIHYHIYFCWQHLPALLLFHPTGIYFLRFFLCAHFIYHFQFLIFIFSSFSIFLFFFIFLLLFCSFSVFLLFFFCFYGTFEFITTL